MIVRLSFLIIFFFSRCFVNTNGSQCMNEQNEPVDWFVIYKLPKIRDGGKFVEDGIGYMFMTSTNYTEWQFSSYPINYTHSLLATTLFPLYKNQSEIGYVLYNDQPPNQPKNPTKGHTKGVVLTDSNAGFWLIHSVPLFPELGSFYKFPSSGTIKGQSFLCVSLDLNNLNKVGTQLQYNQPQIYAKYIPTILKSKLNEIEAVVSGITVQTPPWYNKMLITTKKGATLTSFAKARQFGKDLYKDWVAPALETDLLVETWPNGNGKLASNCSKPFKVYNVVNISINNVAFKNTQDHSKWAVSQNSSWICIGDINRMEHQKLRGGGTACFNNSQLANNYRNIVAAIEKCHN